MTKKDYIKFATLLKTIPSDTYKNNFVLNFNDVMDGVIEIFKSDNKKFDEVRFKKFIKKV